jgi:hypothetical protein
MGYFRRRRPGLVWLALIALAGQIVLTFGHVHAKHDSEVGTQHSDSFGALHEVNGTSALPAKSRTEHRHAPASPDDFDGICAYCRAIAQTACLILPRIGVVRPSQVHLTFRLPHSTSGLVSRDHTAPFQSRAPPPTPHA